jgi:hypothetical protein
MHNAKNSSFIPFAHQGKSPSAGKFNSFVKHVIRVNTSEILSFHEHTFNVDSS